MLQVRARDGSSRKLVVKPFANILLDPSGLEYQMLSIIHFMLLGVDTAFTLLKETL